MDQACQSTTRHTPPNPRARLRRAGQALQLSPARDGFSQKVCVIGAFSPPFCAALNKVSLSPTLVPTPPHPLHPKNYLLKAERDLWGLLGNGWAAPGMAGHEYRRQWLSSIKAATTPRELARPLLDLEEAICRWAGQQCSRAAVHWTPVRRRDACCQGEPVCDHRASQRGAIVRPLCWS